jgi:hypothetical protein
MPAYSDLRFEFRQVACVRSHTPAHITDPRAELCGAIRVGRRQTGARWYFQLLSFGRAPLHLFPPSPDESNLKYKPESGPNGERGVCSAGTGRCRSGGAAVGNLQPDSWVGHPNVAGLQQGPSCVGEQQHRRACGKRGAHGRPCGAARGEERQHATTSRHASTLTAERLEAAKSCYSVHPDSGYKLLQAATMLDRPASHAHG